MDEGVGNKRYSSCRYNERQVIDVTVVRGVGGDSCNCEGHRARKGADTVFHLHLTSSSVVYLQQQQQKSGNIFYFGFPASAGYSPPPESIFSLSHIPMHS